MRRVKLLFAICINRKNQYALLGASSCAQFEIINNTGICSDVISLILRGRYQKKKKPCQRQRLFFFYHRILELEVFRRGAIAKCVCWAIYGQLKFSRFMPIKTFMICDRLILFNSNLCDDSIKKKKKTRTIWFLFYFYFAELRINTIFNFNLEKKKMFNQTALAIVFRLQRFIVAARINKMSFLRCFFS